MSLSAPPFPESVCRDPSTFSRSESVAASRTQFGRRRRLDSVRRSGRDCLAGCYGDFFEVRLFKRLTGNRKVIRRCGRRELFFAWRPLCAFFLTWIMRRLPKHRGLATGATGKLAQRGRCRRGPDGATRLLVEFAGRPAVVGPAEAIAFFDDGRGVGLAFVDPSSLD